MHLHPFLHFCSICPQRRSLFDHPPCLLGFVSLSLLFVSLVVRPTTGTEPTEPTELIKPTKSVEGINAGDDRHNFADNDASVDVFLSVAAEFVEYRAASWIGDGVVDDRMRRQAASWTGVVEGKDCDAAIDFDEGINADENDADKIKSEINGVNKTKFGLDWIAWLHAPTRRESFVKPPSAHLLDQVHRAMMLGASAVVVLALHPRLVNRLERTFARILERPVVVLRAAEANVSLLGRAIVSRFRLKRPRPFPWRFSRRRVPFGLRAASAVPPIGDVTPWARCGRSYSGAFYEWQGVVCLDESGKGRGGESLGTRFDLRSLHLWPLHLWHLLYSASLTLCLFLLLRLRCSGDAQRRSEFVPRVYDCERDVEISLRRLARDALRAMPVTRYQISPKRGARFESQTCPICLSDFRWNQKIRLLPCGHEFHPRCVDAWLVGHRSCPLCKLNIVENLFGKDRTDQ